MILFAISNKFNDPEPKKFDREVKTILAVDEQKLNIDKLSILKK
jgi:hypothetical protein